MAIELDEKSFDSEITSTSAPVIVDFWAPWCGPCRSQAPILDKLAEELGNNVKICKVNIDNEESLAKRFGIMSIPTLLFFKDGELKNKSIGLVSLDRLKVLLSNI